MLIEPTPEKNRAELVRLKNLKLAEARAAWDASDFVNASAIFKDLADICFNLDEFELAMQCLDKEELANKLKSNPAAMAGKFGKYLVPLREKVILALHDRKFDQARCLVNQMLAIAEQAHDIVLIKNYKQQLMQIARLASGKK
nr:hypothetical protein [Candidatus Sigynarchaeota archaeon]